MFKLLDPQQGALLRPQTLPLWYIFILPVCCDSQGLLEQLGLGHMPSTQAHIPSLLCLPGIGSFLLRIFE